LKISVVDVKSQSTLSHPKLDIWSVKNVGDPSYA